MKLIDMKKIIYSALCVAGLFLATSCEDYLETGSPSVVDADFVFSNITTARAAMDGAYETWRDCANSQVFGDGLFYAADVCGSDIERHPEPFANQPGRHYPENLYQNGSFASSYNLVAYMKDDASGPYNKMFAVVGKANSIINAMKGAANFEEFMSAGQPSDLSQLYGEAIALRATAYRELIRNYGDVPFQILSGVAASGLSSRDSIYDYCIQDLKTVEPLMYKVGESSVQKNFFSRTYVQGLIGRMALEAGGYQTRRTDLGADFYKDGAGNVLSFEKLGTDNNSSFYGRRSDWKTLYETAKTYFSACINSPGTAKFLTSDPRSAENGAEYGNPYQYFFQQMNDLEFADESIYEYAMTQGTGNDARPYSFGRVSSGGGSKAYPCKNYGQGRINPAFYYGLFDPKDKRRDVSVAVTGSDGKGREILIPFTPASTAKGGGLTLNKWDENRMKSPYVTKQRLSGINGPYMRMAEIYLGYAEACAATGDDATAKNYLKQIRERSFPTGKANTDAFISSCGSVLDAIIEERGFEFAGEGDRRWTLVRSGKLPSAIKRVKELTKAMMDGLKANGYYAFSNGNTISNYVWTKAVDAKTLYGHRLTTQCPEDKEDDPVLYPGWRGQNNDWEKFGCDYAKNFNTNLAIKGLFKTEVPSKLTVKRTKVIPKGSPEDAKAEVVTEDITTGVTHDKIIDILNFDKNVYSAVSIVDGDGYTLVNWGAQLLDYYDEYYTYLFYDYDYSKAPIYLWPFTPNVISTGGFTNGYGFKQQ